MPRPRAHVRSSAGPPPAPSLVRARCAPSSTPMPERRPEARLPARTELAFASAVQPGGSRFGTALGNRTPYHPQTESSRGGRSEPTPLGSSVLHEVGQLDPDIERLRAPHPMVMCRVTLRGWCAVNVRQEGKGGQAGKRVLAAELDARWQLEGLVDGPVRVAARGACRWPRPR